ncbi:hypothetical protein F4824DRAFT_508968 [Ustulina deusta]|nr:hypothetical protein F4824DRAFT_514817 [Ustulina deusta]KAI3339055.1 hypothetical protein F4824DRAFT_508968 [Ustulina deusta]
MPATTRRRTALQSSDQVQESTSNRPLTDSAASRRPTVDPSTPGPLQPFMSFKTPEPPLFNTLTPPQTNNGVAQPVASHFELQILIADLKRASATYLRIEDLTLFMSHFSPHERFQLRHLLEKLIECCDGLCPTVPDGSSDTSEFSSESFGVDPHILFRSEGQPPGSTKDVIELDSQPQDQSEDEPEGESEEEPQEESEVSSENSTISQDESYDKLNPDTDSPSKSQHISKACMMTSQSVPEFADEGFRQVEQFKMHGVPTQAYKDIFVSLKQTPQDEAQWSDGSEWIALVEAGNQDQQRSSIYYVITAIGLHRWRKSQVQLLQLSLSPKVAAQKVSRRVIGAPEDLCDKNAWERRRKNLNTHLTRGKKWATLVEELGFGILFKEPWSLAKLSEPVLKKSISQLREDASKMRVLRLLGDQMDLLLDTGRTDPIAFREALGEQGLLNPLPLPPCSDVSKEVISLQMRMRRLSPTGALLIKRTTFHFDIDILDRLNETNWLNDNLVLLCLHLADKLSYVRVGLSVPTHRQVRPDKMLSKPFERAAQQVKEWNSLKPEHRLVCFFPLFQRENHFSLLEINQRDGFIYHYDSMGSSSNVGIQTACEDQFPGLKFANQASPCQLDSFSCGPLVIEMACCRMMGRPVSLRNVDLHDAMKLRVDALGLIKKAWYSDAMAPFEQSSKGKRKGGKLYERPAKRSKLDGLIEI